MRFVNDLRVRSTRSCGRKGLHHRDPNAGAGHRRQRPIFTLVRGVASQALVNRGEERLNLHPPERPGLGDDDTASPVP